MGALLKQKAKIGVASRDRRRFDYSDTFKRYIIDGQRMSTPIKHIDPDEAI